MIRVDQTLAKKELFLYGTDLHCYSLSNERREIFVHTLVGCHFEDLGNQ